MSQNDMQVDPLNFRCDWSKIWTVEQLKEEFEYFTFSGPGWYISHTFLNGKTYDDTVLIVPFDSTRYRVFVWNRIGVKEIFDNIVSLPIRAEQKQ